MKLVRYEIHTDSKARGAVLGLCYHQDSWDQVCASAGLDPEEAEEYSDEYELAYPSLPEGEYIFWFTPEGDKNFREYHGDLLAEAAALSSGGKVTISFRDYDPEGVIYEDKDQVVYLH